MRVDGCCDQIFCLQFTRVWSCELSKRAGSVPRGALHIFRVRGRAIGKGIYFLDIGIKNGSNFHNLGIRNGNYFQDFYMKYIRLDILFRKIGIRSGILFQKIGIRKGFVFEASMARPQPKFGQVHPPGARYRFLLTALLTFTYKRCPVFLLNP